MDKEELLLTLAFETIMGEITQTRAYSRVASYIDMTLETWDNSTQAAMDLVQVAGHVHERLHEVHQMVDMTIVQGGPTVDLLLERDLLNALDAELHLVVQAKGDALFNSVQAADAHGQEMLDRFAHALHSIDQFAPGWTIALVAGRSYYREVIVGLAQKMNITLKEEEAL